MSTETTMIIIGLRPEPTAEVHDVHEAIGGWWMGLTDAVRRTLVAVHCFAHAMLHTGYRRRVVLSSWGASKQPAIKLDPPLATVWILSEDVVGLEAFWGDIAAAADAWGRLKWEERIALVATDPLTVEDALALLLTRRLVTCGVFC